MTDIFIQPAAALGEDITPEWEYERSNAIRQLIADLYLVPALDPDGAKTRARPIEAEIPVKVGIVTTNGTTGQTVSLPVTFASIDDYTVDLSWQEDPGGYLGQPFSEKDVDQFIIKVSGSGPGKKIGYTVRRVSA